MKKITTFTVRSWLPLLVLAAFLAIVAPPASATENAAFW